MDGCEVGSNVKMNEGNALLARLLYNNKLLDERRKCQKIGLLV
jgi:hypothetical protein